MIQLQKLDIKMKNTKPFIVLHLVGAYISASETSLMIQLQNKKYKTLNDIYKMCRYLHNPYLVRLNHKPGGGGLCPSL